MQTVLFTFISPSKSVKVERICFPDVVVQNQGKRNLNERSTKKSWAKQDTKDLKKKTDTQKHHPIVILLQYIFFPSSPSPTTGPCCAAQKTWSRWAERVSHGWVGACRSHPSTSRGSPTWKKPWKHYFFGVTSLENVFFFFFSTKTLRFLICLSFVCFFAFCDVNYWWSTKKCCVCLGNSITRTILFLQLGFA